MIWSRHRKRKTPFHTEATAAAALHARQQCSFSQTTYNNVLSAYIRGLFSCWLAGCEVTERLGLQSASLANPYFVILHTLCRPLTRALPPVFLSLFPNDHLPRLVIVASRVRPGSPLQSVANYLERLVHAFPQDVAERHVEQSTCSKNRRTIGIEKDEIYKFDFPICACVYPSEFSFEFSRPERLENESVRMCLASLTIVRSNRSKRDVYMCVCVYV